MPEDDFRAPAPPMHPFDEPGEPIGQLVDTHTGDDLCEAVQLLARPGAA